MPNNNDETYSINFSNIATQILGAVMEHNSKIKQTNEISNRVQNYIHDLGVELEIYILNHSLKEYEGELDSYCQEYSHIIIQSIEEIDSIEKTSDKLNTLKKAINDVIYKIDRVFVENMDFYTEYVHQLLTAAILLQITIYSELSKRCGDHTGQLFILEKMNFFLEKSKINFEYIYTKSKDRHNNYMDHSLHAKYSTYREMINQRKAWEHSRYIQWINLNGNFKFKSTEGIPEFGNFRFNRCTNHTIKVIDNDIRVLAVNNKDGIYEDPSISKEVYDIPAKSICVFTVVMKSSIPNRAMKVVVHEVDKGIIFNNVVENITLENDWTEKVVTYQKQRNDTVLKFEVYWYDKTENDIYIMHTFIDFKQQIDFLVPGVEYADLLPLPDYVSLRNRSTNKANYFHIDESYSSSVYCAANDLNKEFDSPSIFFDVVMMWASDWEKLNVTFEVYLKTRENINREVNLCIHELYPLGGGNYDIKNSVWSQRYKLTNEWQMFSLTCDRQHHTHVRCEIYWHDHNEIDIMLRDIKVIYQLK